MDTLGSPAALLPLLAGPSGAIAALLLFCGYLLRELSLARTDAKSYQAKYEAMRESRDEYRFLTGDAVRAGKRAIQTAVASELTREQHSREAPPIREEVHE